MIRLYLLCCLVLVGSNISVFVDTTATKRKGQDCDIFIEAASDCFLQIHNARVDAVNSLPNFTEYLILSNTVATIRCTEPCFTPIQNFYECQGDTDELTNFNQFQCVQYEGTYCEPLFQVGFQEGTLIEASACGETNTFDVPCPDECRNVTLNNLAVLGCCGREVYRANSALSTNVTVLCGIDIDSFCSGSAKLTASIFGAVTMVTMLAIGLLQ